MIGHNRWTKVTLFSFPQKSSFSTIVQFDPSWHQNDATLCSRQLCLMIFSLKILKCNVLKHNRQAKVVLINFLINLLLGQCGSNLTQNYISLYHINCSKHIQKHFNMIWCNSQTLVILVNFPKKLFFGLGAIREKIIQLYSQELLCENFFEVTQHDGIQQLD